MLLSKEVYEKKLLSIEGEIKGISDNYSEMISDINNVILENYDKSSFSIKELANLVNQSPNQLRSVLKQTTGLTPVKAILEIRLLKAYELLKNQKYSTIKEVIYAVGLTSRDYFVKVFFKRFGVKPVSYTHLTLPTKRIV